MKQALVFVALIFVLFAPQVVSAQGLLEGPIVPAECSTSICDLCDLIVLVNNILNFAVAFTVVVATLMFSYAGILYVTAAANPKNIQQAHGIFMHVLTGLVLVLAAWLIINIILSVLTGRGLSDWTSGITCPAQGEMIQVPPSTGGVTGGVPTPSQPSSTKDSSGFALGCGTGHDFNVQTLKAAGVLGHSTQNCCTQSLRYCTSLNGMKADTIAQVVNIKKVCGRATVTGGTEVGHMEGGLSHTTSGSKVDLATDIDDCILLRTTNLNKTRIDGAALYQDSCGNTYAREASPAHWDITVVNACGF